MTGRVRAERAAGALLCLAHRDHLRREKLCVGSRSASRAISPGFQRYSGQGHLCLVDLASGKLTTVASLLGTTRGLAFYGRFAFVGLSRIRESILFGGLRNTERIDEVQRRCGVLVVDQPTVQILASLHFDAGGTELFDLQVLPGMRFPTVVGFQDQTLDGILIAPPAAWQAGGVATSGATAEERRG